MYTDYRSARSGSGLLNHTSSQSATIEYALLSIARYLDLTVGYDYSIENYGELYGSTLVDGIYQRTSTGSNSGSDQHQLRVSLGKTFPWKQLRIGLSPSYTRSSSRFMLGQHEQQSYFDFYMLSLNYSLSLTRRLKLEGTHHLSVRQVDSQMANRPRAINQRHGLNVVWSKKQWVAKWHNELVCSNTESMPNTLFSDLDLSYRTGLFDLSVVCNNLLGKNYIDQSFYTTTLTDITSYRIRPREVLAKIGFNL